MPRAATPAPGSPWVLAAQPVAGDDVVSVDQRGELRHLADVELAIGVHEHDPVAPRRAEPRTPRRAVAPVARVMDDAHAGVASRPPSSTTKISRARQIAGRVASA